METTKQSSWLLPTPTSSWTGEDSFYPLEAQPLPNMRNDCGCNSPFKNDAGSNFATSSSAADLLKKREEYFAETESKCKEAHKVAVKYPSCKGARKPYCKCVEGRMANYDKTVEETIKFERKQAADAPINAAVASLAEPGAGGAIASSASGSTDVVVYAGLSLVVILIAFMGYNWYRGRQQQAQFQQTQTV
jgi:hypothetical protein